MASTLLAIFLLLGVGAFLTVQVRDVLAQSTGSGLVLLAGLALLFIGERGYGDGSLRLFLSGAGLLVVFGAVGLRYYAMQHSTGARHDGHRRALIWTSVTAGSLLVYALSLDPVTNALGFTESAASRWVGVWWSLFPIATLVGLIPTLLIDRMIGLHPVVMPQGAVRSVELIGVASALAISLMFPINFVANKADVEWDVAYFRTTRAGESTLALVSTLTDPVEAILFFPAGSDVGKQLEPYFKSLADASDGRMTVKVVDQAMDPVLAEELKIRDNGNIVFRQGEATEKFKINTDLDRAKRELRKFDSTVQKYLVKLTRGQRTAYFLVGHGEASWREREDEFRKINLYKREILEGLMGMKVETFGVADGSTDAVPDDASVVIVAGPTEPLLDAEVATLERFYDGGGSLLLMIDPEGDPLTDLLAHVGIQPGKAGLAHAAAHVRLTGGLADRVYLATRKYGSHAAVKQLSRNSAALPMVLPTVMSVTKKEGTDLRVTTLIRTEADAWEDLDGDYQQGPEERGQVYDVAAAVVKDLPAEAGDAAKDEKPREARAVVVGDVAYLSDPVIQRMQGNAVFSLDSMKWLTFDDEITGAVESEEDVKILHTREEDWMWFLAAVVVVPGLVLLAGVLIIRTRQRRN